MTKVKKTKKTPISKKKSRDQSGEREKVYIYIFYSPTTGSKVKKKDTGNKLK